MVEADKPHFAKIVTELALVHRVTLSKELLRAYWEALKEMPLFEFDYAVSHLQKHSEWFPKPAAFYAAAKRGWT